MITFTRNAGGKGSQFASWGMFEEVGHYAKAGLSCDSQQLCAPMRAVITIDIMWHTGGKGSLWTSGRTAQAARQSVVPGWTFMLQCSRAKDIGATVSIVNTWHAGGKSSQRASGGISQEAR